MNEIGLHTLLVDILIRHDTNEFYQHKFMGEENNHIITSGELVGVFEKFSASSQCWFLLRLVGSIHT